MVDIVDKEEQILYFDPKQKSADIRGSLNKFPDFFRMDTFIVSTHMKL